MSQRVTVEHQASNPKDSGKHFPHDQRHIERIVDGDRILRAEWWWEPKGRHCSARHRPHGRS